MARPCSEGVSYFPHETGMFRDKKIQLCGVEFGCLRSYGLYNVLLEVIYEDKGYYAVLDDDAIYILAKETSEKPSFIRECVLGFIRRGLFDERVFNEFQILTSRGIQRRYLRITRSRSAIDLEKALLLVDLNDETDVPAGVRGLICLKNSFRVENPSFRVENPSFHVENPIKESKVNKSKVKEREYEPAPRFIPPTLEDIRAYCLERHNGINPERFFHYYNAREWKNISDWKSAVMAWEHNGLDNHGNEPPPSYDLDSIMQAAVDFDPTKTRRGEV